MKEVVRTMKKSDVNWCTCKDYHNWDVLAEYYFLHFVPNSWVFKYRTLTEHEEGRVLYITGVCNRCGGFMRSGTSVPANICGDELLRHVYQKMLQYRPYDDYDQIGRHYDGAVPERSKWYEDQDDMTRKECGEQFLSLFKPEHLPAAADWLKRKQPHKNRMGPRRDRKSVLFQNILAATRAACFESELEILRDCLAPDGCRPVTGGENTYVTDYRFTVVPILSIEGQGVCLKLYLEGSYDSSDEKWTYIGSLRTNSADADICRFMGTLGGTIMYHAQMYVMRERYRYTPEWKLDRKG